MNQTAHQPGPKFLIIRRDNIGDLVCITPMFRAIREHFPNATICALVNSYNTPVLQNNPDIDAVFAYTKAKHRPQGKSIIRVYWERLSLLAKLRSMHFDYAILATPRFQPRSLRYARLIKPRHIIGFTEEGYPQAQKITIKVPYHLPRPMHESEDSFRLLGPLGIKDNLPAVQIFADPDETEHARHALAKSFEKPPTLRIGIHISARKNSQRWPAENFVTLAKRLCQDHKASLILFWSPGDTSNPLHPGDDAKAAAIMQALPGIPITAYPTYTLRQLIGGLSLCDAVICSDGGAMHLAAGLGKPILCFFGKSDALRWHPWGVPYVLLQRPSLEVVDISVEEALAGIAQLCTPIG